MDSTLPDNRTQDKSRKHRHGSKAKGKGRAEADLYSGGGDDRKSQAYNFPQSSSDNSAQGRYYGNYSHYSSGGQPYRTSSYTAQGDYGGQDSYVPSQGQSLSVKLSGIDTDGSTHKRRDSTLVPLAQHHLPRGASPTLPLVPLSAVPTGIFSLLPETCTSKEGEGEGRRLLVSNKLQLTRRTG